MKSIKYAVTSLFLFASIMSSSAHAAQIVFKDSRGLEKIEQIIDINMETKQNRTNIVRIIGKTHSCYVINQKDPLTLVKLLSDTPNASIICGNRLGSIMPDKHLQVLSRTTGRVNRGHLSIDNEFQIKFAKQETRVAQYPQIQEAGMGEMFKNILIAIGRFVSALF